MFKFLHAADIHLDSPLVGLERYESAPVEEVRGATRKAFENLVELARDEEVAFVLLAGDIYDGDWKDYSTGLFFTKQMGILNKAGIRVFVVRGNHDATSSITRALKPPSNVYLFSSRKTESVPMDDIGAVVHGRSYAKQTLSDDLASGYPETRSGFFNIGLLHTSLDGRPGHDPYAPCSVDVLRSKGYQYWALGHVHSREEVATDPHIIFPGCIQGRNIRETGPKGCMMVTVEDGEVSSTDPRHLDVLRWSLCRVSLDDLTFDEEVLGKVRTVLEDELEAAEGRLLAVRLRLEGVCGIDAKFRARPEHWNQEFRALGASLGADTLWIEKIQFHTLPPENEGGFFVADGSLAGLIGKIQSLADGQGKIEGLDKVIEELRAKLPAEVTTGADGFDPTNPELIREAVSGASRLLLARLLAGGKAS